MADQKESAREYLDKHPELRNFAGAWSVRKGNRPPHESWLDEITSQRYLEICNHVNQICGEVNGHWLNEDETVTNPDLLATDQLKIQEAEKLMGEINAARIDSADKPFISFKEASAALKETQNILTLLRFKLQNIESEKE